ncbi:MAG: hypothetical protein ACPG77_16265, partial [Nannocystaceae bacterium]
MKATIARRATRIGRITGARTAEITAVASVVRTETTVVETAAAGIVVDPTEIIAVIAVVEIVADLTETIEVERTAVEIEAGP